MQHEQEYFMNARQWFEITNIDTIDTPALVFYKDRIEENIRRLKKRVPDADRLRPHVKTNKSADVCVMMMKEGIYKFKCATIAEAEMLATVKAKDVLLAYQPVGPKIHRLLELAKQYPQTHFSCVVDNAVSAKEIAAIFRSHACTLNVYIDINVGMNRTGVTPENAFALYEEIFPLPGISIIGLHVYDGHITDADISIRRQRCSSGYDKVRVLSELITKKYHRKVSVVAGGSPTFPLHAEHQEIECSPGTFVLWDWSYKKTYPDEPFDYAALVVTRVVSIIDSTAMTIDLGHKSVAAENPLPRVHFLNAPEVNPAAHSEEHMMVTVPDTKKYSIGDVLYGVPVHICPTVALYERAMVVELNIVNAEWKITARDKRITL